MISSVKEWGSDKQRLNAYLSQHPDKVDIVGTNVHTGTTYSGLVSDIHYGEYIKVTHKGKDYFFTQDVSGKYIVI